MSMRSAPWDLFETFLAVMREGSLSGAARVLGTAQPTVRRQIEALEGTLGVVLFTRSPAGLLATDDASRILPYAETMAATAEAFVRAASGSESAVAGTVRLTCSEIVGAEVLPPIIVTLLARYPELDVEVVPTNLTQDLLRRDADLAVRMTRPTQAALVARRIGEIEVGLHASEIYLAEHPMPETLADLANGHVLVGEDRGHAMEPFLRSFGLDPSAVRFAYRSDSDLAQFGAIRAGVGIGGCQTALAGPGTGLVRVLPALRIDLETWIVMHEDLRSVPRVRAVFDHLVESFTAYARPRSSAVQ